MRLCGLYAYQRAYGADADADATHCSTFLDFHDTGNFSLQSDVKQNQDRLNISEKATAQRSSALVLLAINMAVNHSLQVRSGEEGERKHTDKTASQASQFDVHDLEETLVGSSQDEKVRL